MPTPPRQHHYIPQSILKHFSRDNQSVWCVRPGAEPFRSSVKKIAVERDLYKFTDQDGEANFEVETSIDTKFTDPALPVIEKLREKLTISLDDKHALAWCISMMHARRPSIKNFSETIVERTASALKTKILDDDNFVKAFAVDLYGANPSIAQQIEAKSFLEDTQIKSNNTAFLGAMADLAEETQKILSEGYWKIFHPPNNAVFIRNENTLIGITDTAMALGENVWKKTSGRVFIPICLDLAIEVKTGDSDSYEHCDLTRDLVKRYNRATSTTACDFIIGPDERLVKSLARFVKTEQSSLGISSNGQVVEKSDLNTVAKEFTETFINQ
jgi:Protein of unknown function (DUF4238)